MEEITACSRVLNDLTKICPKRQKAVASTKILWITGLVLFSSLFIGEVAISQVTPKSIEFQKWRLVRLAEHKHDGFHFLATGFVLVRDGQTYVVTCRHTLAEVGNREQLYADFGPPVMAHLAVVLGEDKTSDTAILKVHVKLNGATEERIADGDSDLHVFVAGFDEGHMDRGDFNIQEGKIVLAKPWVDAERLFITSGEYHGATTPALLITGVVCRAGGSGSPVFRTDGAIVGMVKASVQDGGCVAIGIQPIVRLLRSVLQKPSA